MIARSQIQFTEYLGSFHVIEYGLYQRQLVTIQISFQVERSMVTTFSKVGLTVFIFLSHHYGCWRVVWLIWITNKSYIFQLLTLFSHKCQFFSTQLMGRSKDVFLGVLVDSHRGSCVAYQFFNGVCKAVIVLKQYLQYTQLITLFQASSNLPTLWKYCRFVSFKSCAWSLVLGQNSVRCCFFVWIQLVSSTWCDTRSFAMHTVIHRRILRADETSTQRWCKAAHGAYSGRVCLGVLLKKVHMVELNQLPTLATNYCNHCQVY